MMTLYETSQKYEEALLKDLAEIMRIPSVLDEKTQTPQTPFGIETVRALSKMEEFARRDGFLFGRFENRVTWIEYGPADAEETVGILVHIDVVPAGKGWNTPPFQATIIADKLYGRGAADMKSDVMTAYYALKYLKDQKTLLKRKIRLIIGTDEENNWRDLPSYFAKFGEPTMGFSPDGAFPVINGEKAFQTIQLRFPSESRGPFILLRFIAGEQSNVVPGEARARIKVTDNEQVIADFNNYLMQYPFLRGQTQLEKDYLRLILYGRQAHGAYPQDGENAGTYLAHFLNQYAFEDDAKAFLTYLDQLHLDILAKSLDLNFIDSEMGALTLNIGIMRFNYNGQGQIFLGFRYPQGVTLAQVKKQVQSHLGELHAVISVKAGGMEPHLVPLSDPLVHVLSLAYATEVGMYAPPKTSSGASYAHLLKRGVAFGGQFPDLPVTSHQANEYVPVANLTKTMAIFIRALLSLDQI